MISEPKIERRKKQYSVARRMAVPIPFGKYLQPAWDEVYDWMTSKEIKPSGPYRGKGIFKATVALLEWAKENKVKWNITRKRRRAVEWPGRVLFL